MWQLIVINLRILYVKLLLQQLLISFLFDLRKNVSISLRITCTRKISIKIGVQTAITCSYLRWMWHLISDSVVTFFCFDLNIKSFYREFSPYANFITANFITAVFRNYYKNLGNVILWAIYFVTAYTKWNLC